MICSPTGRPSAVTPAGTEMAGFQHRLASIVNGVVMAPSAVSQMMSSIAEASSKIIMT